MNKIDEIKKRRVKINALEKEIKELEELGDITPEHELATLLHEALCRWNHTDGCGWYYQDNWEDSVHQRYLKVAEKILAEGISLEVAKRIVLYIRGDI